MKIGDKVLTDEQLIDYYEKFISVCLGSAMLPCIESGINSVKLIKVGSDYKPKLWSLVLYKSDDSVQLRRIVKIKNRKGKLFVCGDNEFDSECIDKSDVIAICVCIVNTINNTYVNTISLKFRLYSLFRMLSKGHRHRKYLKIKEGASENEISEA